MFLKLHGIHKRAYGKVMFLRFVLLRKRAYGKVMFLKPFSLQRGLWKSYVLESLFFAKGFMEKLCSRRLSSKRYAPEACGLQRNPLQEASFKNITFP